MPNSSQLARSSPPLCHEWPRNSALARGGALRLGGGLCGGLRRAARLDQAAHLAHGNRQPGEVEGAATPDVRKTQGPSLVTGDAVRASQDPIAHGSEARRLADRGDRGQAQPRLAGLGRLLPPRQLGAEVRRDRPLPPRASGDLDQCEARAPRTELAAPLHGGVAGPPWRLSPRRKVRYETAHALR
jgi:hypothetical protein